MPGTRNAAGFPILGRPLRVRIRSEALGGWLQEHWHRRDHAIASHAFTIALTDRRDPPVSLTGEPARARLLGFDVPFTVVGTGLEYREGASGVRLELPADGAGIRVWGVPRSDSARAPRFWGALHVVVHEALRASGLLPFHAAVVARDGRAIALAGPSGAGKSTTLLHAARRDGWAILAEDLSWLDPGTLRLYGWDGGLRLWPEAIRRFAPDLADAPWTDDARGKRFVPWAALDVALQRAARLDAVLSLSEHAERAGPPVGAPEALKMLWEATGMPLLPVVRARVAEALAGMLHRVRFGRHALGAPVAPPR